MFNKYIENIKFFIFKNQSKKILFFFLILLICLSSILELVGVGILAAFVILIINPENNEIFGFEGLFLINNLSEYQFYFFVVIFFLLKNIFIFFVEFRKSTLLSNSFLNFQKKNVNAFLDLDYSFYKKLKASSFSKNINFSTERTFVGLGESFFSLINEILIFILILLLLSITLSSYIFVGGVIIGLIYILIFKRIKSISSKLGVQYTESASKIFSITDGIFNGFKEILIYNKKKYFINYFHYSVDSFAKAWKLSRFVLNILKYVNETLIIILIVIAILTLKIFGIEINSINFSFATLAIAIIRLYPNLSKIQNTLTFITITMPICSELKSFYVNSILNKDQKKITNETNSDNREQTDLSLELRNISFKYDDKYIFNNLNISFKKNKKYFIYGPSGSGKTTLLEIICGLLPPSNGSLYLNKDIKKKLLSYVPQETFLIDTDIFNNVSLFDKRNNENILKVENSLKEVNLFEVIKYNREGLKTEIGEKGVKLSTGQKQRLALARAMYQDRDIIVLDEPSSNLDKKTEEIFLNNLIENSKSKTIILVSHNLNFFEHFDYTYLLKEGKLHKIETNSLNKLKELL